MKIQEQSIKQVLKRLASLAWRVVGTFFGIFIFLVVFSHGLETKEWPQIITCSILGLIAAVIIISAFFGEDNR